MIQRSIFESFNEFIETFRLCRMTKGDQSNSMIQRSIFESFNEYIEQAKGDQSNQS